MTFEKKESKARLYNLIVKSNTIQVQINTMQYEVLPFIHCKF